MPEPNKTPMTGAEYLASLDDSRAVYIYGERVTKVTEHPAFRNTALMIAGLYDAPPIFGGDVRVPAYQGIAAQPPRSPTSWQYPAL